MRAAQQAGRKGTGLLRRRRGRKRSTPMAGSPYELFMDAITNTMGVVMFILLMVVLFGRSPPPIDLPRSTAASELQDLRKERDELVKKVDALPPASDPQFAQRWRIAMEQMALDRTALDDARREILQRTALAAVLKSRAETDAQHTKALQELVQQLTQPTRADRGFVRMSLFRADARPAVVLAMNGGKLSRPSLTKETKMLPPPMGGEPAGTPEQARAAIASLMSNAPSSTHRVELVVWEDSFKEAKLVEQILLEMGYDTNPLPVESGKAMGAGTGGVQ